MEYLLFPPVRLKSGQIGNFFSRNCVFEKGTFFQIRLNLLFYNAFDVGKFSILESIKWINLPFFGKFKALSQYEYTNSN